MDNYHGSTDPLTLAILDAGSELAQKHDWCFDGDPGVPPEEDDPFVGVMKKHLLPVVDINAWRRSRIAALKSELAYWESL